MNGPMLHAVEVAADSRAVFEAITTQDGVAGFWTSDLDLQPVVGSIGRFGFPAAPVDLRMRVDALEPGRQVRWACLGDFPHWAGTTVAWDLSAGPTGGTMVVFRHDGWLDDYPELDYASINYTWGRIVGALKALVETGTSQPFLG
jgi:uncharacterized protein YndB with AHSA1/START domain